MRQTAASLKQSSRKGLLSKLKRPNDKLFAKSSAHARSTSLTASPSHPSGSSQPKPTSSTTTGPSDEKTKRLQAIKVPVIHLLAARPLSAKYLAQLINCSQDDVRTVLEKVGRAAKLDASKYNLTDKAFKDLDVWKFKYKETSDRDSAIRAAVAAFDRMRMSQSEPKWQMLYPPQERGRGKTLSNLTHLHNGQIPMHSSLTPRIHVQHPDEGSGDPTDTKEKGDQQGHLTPNAAESGSQSKASGSSKKPSKPTNKDAKVKRLTSKGPKKVAPLATSKDPHPAVKKGGKKVVAPKSEEFVHDSDDDEDLFGDGFKEPSSQSQSTQKPKSPQPNSSQAESSQLKSPQSKSPQPKSAEPTIPQPKSTSLLPSEKSKADTTSKKPKDSIKAVQKPSSQSARPSPEDLVPLTATSTVKPGKEVRKEVTNGETKPSHKRVPSSPVNTPNSKNRPSDASQGSTAMQKSLSRNRTLSSPHKPSPLGSSPPTNASEFGSHLQPSSSLTSPASKTLGTPNGVNGVSGHHLYSEDATPVHANGYQTATPPSSDASLKRKANDMESGIHNHDGLRINGLTNGNKRRHTSSLQRPECSDSSTSPLSDHELMLATAQRFKDLHAKYVRSYKEAAKNPSDEGMSRVIRMHERLESMKKEIERSVIL